MSDQPIESGSRRPLGLELALVVVVSLAVFVPGIWSYSLVDPWETHYGEVARNMVKDGDLVHMQWRRYFVITEAGRAASVKSMLPTERGRNSLEVLDTTSNKFSLVGFYQ